VITVTDSVKSGLFIDMPKKKKGENLLFCHLTTLRQMQIIDAPIYGSDMERENPCSALKKITP
jgi:hypothetical protein